MTKVYATKRAITCGVEEVTLTDNLPGGTYLSFVDKNGRKDVVHKKHVFDNYADAVADCKLKIKSRIDSLTNQIKGLEHLLRKADAGVY